jgi:hypothetical protein
VPTVWLAGLWWKRRNRREPVAGSRSAA